MPYLPRRVLNFSLILFVFPVTPNVSLFFFLKVEGVPGRSSCSLHMVLQRNPGEQCLLPHPSTISRAPTDRLWAADFPCGEDSGVPTATSLFCPPLSVLQLCLLCLALPERRLWASTTYTSHLIWPNISSVPGLFYPLCHTATWPHNTGKGPNCGHTGQDRQAQSLPVPHADALGLYSEATSPQLMYGLNSTPTGRQPFC